MSAANIPKRDLPYEESLPFGLDTFLWRVEEGWLLRDGAPYVDLASVEELRISHGPAGWITRYTKGWRGLGLSVRQQKWWCWRLQFRIPGFKQELRCLAVPRKVKPTAYPDLERQLIDELVRQRPDILVRVAAT